VAELRNLAEVAQSDRQLELDRKQREIENEISQSNIQARLIAQLPEIAQLTGSSRTADDNYYL
jgi:flotillin